MSHYSICPHCEAAYDSRGPGQPCDALVPGVGLCRGVTIAPDDFVQLAWFTGRVELLRQLVAKGTGHAAPPSQPTWNKRTWSA